MIIKKTKVNKNKMHNVVG